MSDKDSKQFKEIDKAIRFAAKKHAGQRRKGTDIPYMTHVVEVMEIVSRMTEDENVRIAALLHDTLEDTQTKKEELKKAFGCKVADLVASESENKREGQPAEETWIDRKWETIQHLKKACTNVRMIALGDKLSNIRAMYRDYQAIGEELWKRFNQHNPVLHGWYYCSIRDVLGKDDIIKQNRSFEEYSDLCEKVFKPHEKMIRELIDMDEKPDQKYSW